jgi:acetylornithine deacetylase/succinyl-diaminopimelate desuccinylase-like protein
VLGTGLVAAPSDVNRLIEDAKRICAVPAPTFAEAQRAELVRGMLGEAGAQPRIDEIGNVVCAFGNDEEPTVVFAAHLDTVFPAEQRIVIDHDPARGTIAAPGIGDNSLSVAALVALARRFVEAPPAGRVMLAATVGEEGLGDLRGARHLLAVTPCRAFVAVEGATLDSIKHAGVGSIRYRVTYRGPGGHSWSDRGAPSAVHGLLEAGARFLTEPAPPDVARNIGRFSGGTSINTIAAEASLELDLRGERTEQLAAVAARARAVFGKAPPGLHADVETIGERPAGGIAAEHPLMQAARRVREIAGLPPAEEGSSSTDANAAYGRGIPAITVGLTTGANGHRVDERINLGPLAGGMRALELLADELAGAEPDS